MSTTDTKPAAAESTASPKAASEKLASKASGKGGRSTGKMSFRAAAEKVLREADGPMHAKAITETVLERKLAVTGGKTPVASMNAILLRSPEFVKTDKSTFDVRELNPRGAKKRPKAS